MEPRSFSVWKHKEKEGLEWHWDPRKGGCLEWFRIRSQTSHLRSWDL